LAVASAAKIPLYSGYAYPSLYSTGLTYTYPSVYSHPLVTANFINKLKDNPRTKRSPQVPVVYYTNTPSLTPAQLEDVEKVFDLTANFINKLKDNPRTKRSPQVPVVYYSNAYNTAPITSAQIEDVEKVFDLIINFIKKLKDAPTAEAETSVKTKRSPAVPVAYYANAYETVPATAPVNAKIEDIEKVFGLIANFVAELKANIPTDAIPPAAIPTGAIPSYPGAAPVNYQASDVNVEQIQAVFSLIQKFTAQLLANSAAVPAAAPTESAPAVVAAPIEATPSTYQLIEPGCRNNLGVSVPCALRRKRSPLEAVAAPVVYNAVPITYVAKPLTYTYPVATPVTYNAVELENKPKIEDVEKVFDLTADLIKGLKDAIPADSVKIPPVNIPSVNIPPVNIPSVNIPPVNIPSVNIPTVNIPPVNIPAVNIPAVAIPTVPVPAGAIPAGPINGAIISGF